MSLRNETSDFIKARPFVINMLKTLTCFQITPRGPTTRIHCTHVAMDRLHSCQLCDVCGRRPSMGWLYHCRQDDYQSNQAAVQPEPAVNATSSVSVPSKRAFLQDPSQLEDLQDLGFGSSILKQASEGRYTTMQIEKLKQQRQNVGKAVQAQKLGSFMEETESVHPNITIRKRKNSKAKHPVVKRPGGSENFPCFLKCCHVSVIPLTDMTLTCRLVDHIIETGYFPP
jgi:hypothetical protein